MAIGQNRNPSNVIKSKRVLQSIIRSGRGLKGWGNRHFTAWYSWSIRSRLDSTKKVARMIKAHLNQILKWFTCRISNAVSEGLNSKIQTSKIQTVKSNAPGVSILRKLSSQHFVLLWKTGYGAIRRRIY